MKFNSHRLLNILTWGVLFWFTSFNLIAGQIKGKISVFEERDGKKMIGRDHSLAVVYLTEVKDTEEKSEKRILDQINSSFSPRVIAIKVGTTVRFNNFDKIYHNAWSLSKSNPFDLGTFKSPDFKEITFKKPGLVKVFCNIHPEMISSILVLKNKFFKVTDQNGDYEFTNLPAGNITVRVWVEG